MNLNTWTRLREYLKNKTKDYIVNKAATFGNDDIDKSILVYFKSEDHRKLLAAVTILVAYYGLLRMADIMKIMPEDVIYNKKEGCYQVVFHHKRKHKNQEFTYFVPSCYNIIMKTYIDQFSVGNGKTRFLRNFNVKAQMRIQNAGKTNLGKFAKETPEMLGLDPTKYSNHFWRRSGATNLADNGCSKTNLKRHDQWTSDTVAEGYIANSRPLRLEKMNLLKPTRLQKEDKQKENTENVVALMSVLKRSSVVNAVPEPIASQTLEIFLKNPGKENQEPLDETALTQLEDDDVDPPVAKKPKLPAEILKGLNGPLYTNCNVTIS